MTCDPTPVDPPPLRFLYRSVVNVAEPLSVGQIAAGQRRIINITGGTFSGPAVCVEATSSTELEPTGRLSVSDGITEVKPATRFKPMTAR